ncbi:MAG: flagellar export protein FliJ [Thermoguttaceae bacterium]|jgi:flagellar FliJ protein
MARFNFRLATLLRLREATRDERRQQLAKAFEAEEILRRQALQVDENLAALHAHARKISGPGHVNADSLLEAQRFELTLKAHKQQLGRQQEMVRAEIEQRRAALVEANREAQILERLRERQYQRYREEENRREIRVLDEAAQRGALSKEFQE